MYVAQRARERAEVLEERLEGYKGSGKPIMRGLNCLLVECCTFGSAFIQFGNMNS